VLLESSSVQVEPSLLQIRVNNMAIKVTLSTLTAVREELPDYLTKDEFTLQNLQSIANPVPDYLFDIEYWPEVDDTPAFDARTHVKGAETLTPDDGPKTVSVVCALDDIPLSEVVTLCEKEVMNKMNQVSAEEIDIGGGFLSTLRELQANRDLFDDGGPGSINFKNGHKSLTAVEKATIKSTLRSRSQDLHNRAGAILDLIEAEATGETKIAVLDAELPVWP